MPEHSKKNEIIDLTLGSLPFSIYTSIYTLLITWMIGSAVSEGIRDIHTLFFESFLLMFFYLVGLFFVELLGSKKLQAITFNRYVTVLLLKAGILFFIPVLIALVQIISLKGRVAPASAYSILAFFFLLWYWLLLSHVIALYLKRGAWVVFLFFLFYPGWYDRLEDIPGHDLFPFQIVMTISESLLEPTEVPVTVTACFLFYIVALLLLLRLKTNQTK